MFIRRIVYVITLACSVAFYALYPYWISQYIMVLILLLIPFDLLVSMPGMLIKRISLTAPKVLDMGESGTLVLTTYQKKPLPSGRIKTRLNMTAEDFSEKRKIICDPESDSRYEIAIDTSHSGVTFFEIKRLHTTSIIGLFSLVIAAGSRVTVLILPAPVKPKNIVTLPRGLILRPKPGGGFSEDSDLRPYRRGDPVRIIHWKLSAKYDSLVIREPMIPPDHSRLVHIVNWSGARERDIILGRLRWISDYLLKWELSYYIKLGDNGSVAEITCEKEFMDYLCSIMGNEELSGTVPLSIPIRFSWVFHIDAKEGTAE